MDMHVHLASSGTNLVRILMTPGVSGAAQLDPQQRAPPSRPASQTVRDAAGHTPVGVRLAAEAGYFPAPRMELDQPAEPNRAATWGRPDAVRRARPG